MTEAEQAYEEYARDRDHHPERRVSYVRVAFIFAYELAEKEAKRKWIRQLTKQKDYFDRARPLCPDHRDKQKGKGCLACRIEKAKTDSPPSPK